MARLVGTGLVLLFLLDSPLASGNPLLFKATKYAARALAVDDPDMYLNATELITTKGFPCDNFYVTTADGYILNLLRIPHGRNNSHLPGPRPVVILQHGLLGSCTNYLTNLVNESLAYILADAGADVWLGNSRGSIYSTNHTTLSPKEDAFWDFTFDDMAEYDLPAMINFILAEAGVDQVHYVGHSQGTTIAFAKLSEDQTLASRIKHFMALAPVARTGHIKSPIRLLAPFAKDISVFLDLFGHGAFEVLPPILRYLQGDLCESWGERICTNILFLGCGVDFSSWNMSRVPVYMAHNPGGTSVRNILHWAQDVNTDNFQKFDYGSREGNMKHYNQSTPPLYNPKNMKVPVAIFRGGQDWLADPEDVQWLLPQLHVTHDVNIPHYAHLDFIWAVDAPSLIYKYILDIVFP